MNQNTVIIRIFKNYTERDNRGKSLSGCEGGHNSSESILKGQNEWINSCKNWQLLYASRQLKSKGAYKKSIMVMWVMVIFFFF